MSCGEKRGRRGARSGFPHGGRVRPQYNLAAAGHRQMMVGTEGAETHLQPLQGPGTIVLIPRTKKRPLLWKLGPDQRRAGRTRFMYSTEPLTSCSRFPASGSCGAGVEVPSTTGRRLVPTCSCARGFRRRVWGTCTWLQACTFNRVGGSGGAKISRVAQD